MAFAFILLRLALAFALSGGDTGADDVDAIEGTDGSETLQGSNDDDVIHARGGNDQLVGHQGNDTLHGDEGNDLIYPGQGNDQTDGGDGNDTIAHWDGHDTIMGGAGDDSIIAGSPDGTVADGGAGNDQFTWEAGDATLRGGEGDDTIVSNAPSQAMLVGNGQIDGGEGRDVLTLNTYPSEPLDLIYDAEGTGRLSSNGNEITLQNIEEVHFGNGEVRVDASQSNAAIHIVAPQSSSDALPSQTTLIGSAGDDTLVNGREADGGAGDDLLAASRSGSTLTGGEGADTFTYDFSDYYDIYEQTYASQTATITDFNPAEDQATLTVRYNTSEFDPSTGITVPKDPPEVQIINDTENNQTVINVGNRPAMILQGVTDLDPSRLTVTMAPIS